MSTDNIFRFVTLRAPPPADESFALTIIEPADGELAVFTDTLAAVSADAAPRERLIMAAEKILGSPRYLLNDPRWRLLFGSKELDTLLALAELAAPEFRQMAEKLLATTADPQASPAPNWNDPGLRQGIWAGYCASVVASGEHGRESRFYLDLLRVMFAWERASAPGFDLIAPGLAQRRAALPASLFIDLQRAPPPDAPESGDDNPQLEVERRRLNDKVLELRHAFDALIAAREQKRQRLLEQTRTMQARAVNGATANQDIVLDIPPPVPAGDSSLQRLLITEIADKRAVKILADHSINPAVGLAPALASLEQLIGANLAALDTIQWQETVAWERGTFVRIPRPIRPSIY